MQRIRYRIDLGQILGFCLVRLELAFKFLGVLLETHSRRTPVKLILVLSLFLSVLPAHGSELTPYCEKKIIRETIKHKESSLFLSYEITDVTDDLLNTIVTVVGGFHDGEADFGYQETHEVRLKKGTCDIESVTFVGSEDF
jgi:hypothetical protein